jgi:hypothetical protein
VLLGVDVRSGVVSLVDWFYGRGLGVGGLREKLLVEPIDRYWPRYTVYEKNREESVLEHPAVLEVVDRTRTELVRHYTNQNRAMGEFRVAAMALDMRDGLLRFPAFSGEDRRALGDVKQQFANWDERTLEGGRTRSSAFGGKPDDVVMALWVAWVKCKELVGRGRRGGVVRTGNLAPVTLRKWAYGSVEREAVVPVRSVSLAGLWRGDAVES